MIRRLINKLHREGVLDFLPSSTFLKICYWGRTGEFLDLKHPKTFNDKLNWLKLHNQIPCYSLMADKYEVKRIVEEKIGAQYVVPCYGVWNSFEEVDFTILPDQFVLKGTHDSSGATVCRDKSCFDFAKAKNKFDMIMKRNWYYAWREWPYKNIKPRIIADKYLDDGRGSELQDYKFWCFDGVPKVMYLTNKGQSIYENFYDMEFKPLDIDHGFPRVEPEYAKPENFELMKKLASELSKGIPFVRVDFFNVNGHVYFGEFTFYDWGGQRPFISKEWDNKLGSWINIDNIHND